MQETTKTAGNLGCIELKPLVPARDYLQSQRFYLDLGFTLASDGHGVSYFHHGSVAFLLQDFFQPVLAEQLSLHLLVESVDAWWAHIQRAELVGRYGARVSPIQQQPWRMRDFALHDPSGVLWCIAENSP